MPQARHSATSTVLAQQSAQYHASVAPEVQVAMNLLCTLLFLTVDGIATLEPIYRSSRRIALVWNRFLVQPVLCIKITSFRFVNDHDFGVHKTALAEIFNPKSQQFSFCLISWFPTRKDLSIHTTVMK